MRRLNDRTDDKHGMSYRSDSELRGNGEVAEMAGKMRLTAHNGRAGKNGVYCPKHNDRNFDARQADHIDESRSGDNWYWHCYQKNAPDMSFEDAEAYYYERHFRQALDERNEKSIEARHPERVKTMDDYRASKKTCPEEQIMQIGREGQTVDPKLLQEIAIEQIRWEQRQYPNYRLLDVALHVDEQGAPHIHKRGVWVAHENGLEVVGQAKALAEMGIEAPDPSKKYGKYNNAKMTYTKECREHLAELCLERGIELELAPKEHSKSGLALEEYKARQEQEKARQAQEQAQEYQRQAQEQAQVIQQQQAELTRMASEKEELEKSTRKAQKALDKANEALSAMSGKQQELEAVQAQIKTAQKELKTTLDMKARASEIHKVFGDRDTQTYHRNMLESTRAIGSEAYDHMKKAESKLSQVAKRETAVKAKEQEIEPLYKAAAKDRAQAKEYLEKQESYILGTAENKAQEKFDNFIEQEFSRETKGRSGRMEKFLDSFTQDGKSLLDMFDEQEQALQLELSRSWGIER